MFLVFLVALIFFMLVGIGVVWLASKVLNNIEKDNAKTEVKINDIYIDSVNKNEGR